MNLLHRKDNGNKALTTLGGDGVDDWWGRMLRLPLLPFESRLPEVFNRAQIPAMNVSEDEKGYEITLELPGLEEDDIDISVMGNQLVISGERKWEEKRDKQEFHHVESQYGSFQRSFALPTDARTEVDAIEARYKKGMLHVQIPKVEPTPTRKIKVSHEK